MEININWERPLSLIDGTHQNRVYTPEDESPLTENPGVYVFARKHGNRIIPLYVGRANNLNVRISQQLNNVQLMKGIQNSPQGNRLLILGKLRKKPGQNLLKVLRIVESALIEQSLSQGFDILNKQGKNRPTHTVYFTGNREAKLYSGKEVKTRAVK